MTKRLYRVPARGKIAGVAAGFAEYFDMDVTLMRLLFVAALLLSGGAVIIVYIVFAFVMPVQGVSDKGFDVSEKAETLAEEMKSSGRARNLGNYTGLFLILLGVWLLLGQFFPVVFNLQWSIIWPCLVILLGLWIITKGRN